MKKQDYAYIAYTDGGCRNGYGGIGCQLIETATGEVTEISQGFKCTTNNRMELMAIISVLQRIPEGSKILIYTDSKYAIGFLDGTYRRNTNWDLGDIGDPLMATRKVTFQHVPGHSGIDGNERCDELATEAIRSIMGREQMLQGEASPQSAMDANIDDVPEEIRFYSGEHREIKDACRCLINKVNSNKHLNFKAFKELKTGGLDEWSSVKLPELRKLVPDDAFQYLADQLEDDDKDIAVALRWYCRGLRLDLAARKLFVDREIRMNAQNASMRY